MIVVYDLKEIQVMKKIVIKTVMVIVLVLHFLILVEYVQKVIQDMTITVIKIVMEIVLVKHL